MKCINLTQLYIIPFSLIALLIWCNICYSQNWEKSTEIYTNQYDSKSPIVVFVNTYTQDGLIEFPPERWITVDLTKYGVASNAKWAFLSGLLIITHGAAIEIADLTVALQAPGSRLTCKDYIGQTIEAHRGGGQRSSFASYVPLNEGKFQLCWTKSNDLMWPNTAAFGINLTLQAWGR